MSINEMARKVRELKELKQLQEELAAEIATLENEIKAEMAARDVEEITVEVFKVRWKPVTSCRLDTKALKAALPDVYYRFATENTTRRFSIA